MKNFSIDNLFDALTENMSSADIKSAMVISEISSQIEIERLKRGMTQQEFANFMGVSQGMISKWESGDYNFTIEAISNIFDKLDMDFEFEITPNINLITLSGNEGKMDFSKNLNKKYKDLLIAG